MESGTAMDTHLDAFDEPIVGMQTLGEHVGEARQLVVLLNSLPPEYEMISSILENTKDVTLSDVNEKLLKEFKRWEKKRITVMDVLYIPGLARRLLSVGKLAQHGLNVEFQRSSCVIWRNASAVALGKKVGKAFVLDCDQESARFVEYAGANSKWELWDDHMEHPSENGMANIPKELRTVC
ncbi:unnamed protein product [Phytophthora fragariaefolia]|uniref:Unnamed protein product n=1 Tax=Phytophthora fragariaefolia TaxID=1490495 RepID=A0A9W6TUT4_9STRA|nr:unnamed protein product [Phytophthora fragariaefolia]